MKQSGNDSDNDVESVEKIDRPSSLSREKNSKKLSTIDMVNATIHHYVVNHPPSAVLADFPRSNVYYLLTVSGHIFFFSLFIFWFIQGIQSGMSSKLISLSKDAGSCFEVFRLITKSSTVATNGIWEGRVGFNYFQAAYDFQFDNLNGSNYEKYINHIVDDVINPVGLASKSQPLFLNLLYWCSFIHQYQSPISYPNEKSITQFEFTGNFETVLDQPYIIVKLLRYTYTEEYLPLENYTMGLIECLPKVVNYNKLNGELAISWGFGDFPFYGDGYNSPYSACARVLPTGNPSYLGWVSFLQGFSFTFVIDQLSLLLAVSVNLGVLNSSTLQDAGMPIPENIFSTVSTDESNNFGLELHSKFDPRFPGHKPLFCTTKSDGKQFCFIDIAGRLCIPNFSAYNSSFNSCINRDPMYENILDMIVSCIFVPPDFFTDNINGGEVYGDNDELVSSILSLDPFEINSLGQRIREDPEGFDQICHGCFVVWNNIYSPSNNLVVNEFFYILNKGHCNDTFSPDPSAKEQLLLSPPLPLTENYFECTDTIWTILSNSYGVASSNAISVGTILIGLAAYLYLVIHNFDLPETNLNTADNPNSKSGGAVGGGSTRKFSLGISNAVSPMKESDGECRVSEVTE